MQDVTIYTRILCGYCSAAKRLLKQKGALFEEINATLSRSLRDEMQARAGGRQTFPQIFIGGRHIGGCDELYELDRQGKLDPLLLGEAPSVARP
jgi:glutaredoxin 3